MAQVLRMHLNAGVSKFDQEAVTNTNLLSASGIERKM